MPGLTVTEKEHWKDRFSQKIDKKIDAIYAEDANLNERIQRDNLLDSVWLATSPRQIKTFWEKVADLLGDKPTELQRDALAIEPVSDD